jgi:hypothetical protein
MNKHAQQVWQAAVSGNAVQRYKFGEWVDDNPFETLPMYWPQNMPEKWRVKLKTRVRYYRVWLESNPGGVIARLEHSNSSDHMDRLLASKARECSETFRGWFTEWTPYEVKIEYEKKKE